MIVPCLANLTKTLFIKENLNQEALMHPKNIDSKSERAPFSQPSLGLFRKDHSSTYSKLVRFSHQNFFSSNLTDNKENFFSQLATPPSATFGKRPDKQLSGENRGPLFSATEISCFDSRFQPSVTKKRLDLLSISKVSERGLVVKGGLRERVQSREEEEMSMEEMLSPPVSDLDSLDTPGLECRQGKRGGEMENELGWKSREESPRDEAEQQLKLPVLLHTDNATNKISAAVAAQVIRICRKQREEEKQREGRPVSLCELEVQMKQEMQVERELPLNKSLSDMPMEMEEVPKQKTASLRLESPGQVSDVEAAWLRRNRLECHTLREAESLVVDCRYGYEFEGGHIEGAVNIRDPEALEHLFIKRMDHMYNRGFLCRLRELGNEPMSVEVVEKLAEQHPEPERDCAPIVIVHCEFSQMRGPRVWNRLRRLDRDEVGIGRFPFLNYPDLYLLSDGYSQFVQQYSDLCTPAGKYRKMSESRVSEEWQREGREVESEWERLEGSRKSKRRSRW